MGKGKKNNKLFGIKSPKDSLEEMKKDSTSTKGIFRNAARLSNFAPTITSKIIVYLLAIIIPIIIIAVLFIIFVGGSFGIMTIFVSQDAEIAHKAENTDTGSTGGGSNQSLDRLNSNIPDSVKGKFLLTWNLDYVTSIQGGGRGHKALDLQPSGGRRGGKYTFPDEKYLYIYPAYPGEVMFASSDFKTKKFLDPTYGNVVVLRHEIEGAYYYTLYAHLQKAYVSEGDIVDYKNKIGLMGCTGRSFGSGLLGCGGHLHLEIRNSDFREPSGRFVWTKGELKVADMIACSDSTTMKNAVGNQYSCIEYTERILGGKPSEIQ